MKMKLTALVAATLAATAVTTSAPAFAAQTRAEALQSVRSSLKPGQVLKAGQWLRSPNGRYRLVMQKDGNLVVLKGSTSIWSSHTWVKGATATMRKDGDLVVAKGTRKLWSSHTAGRAGAYLTLQNDGNAVVYKGRTALWSSYQWISTLPGGVTLYAYQKVISRNSTYQLRQEPNGDLVLYKSGKRTWHTGTAGHPGAFTVMQTNGNLVVYSKTKGKTKALWASQTKGAKTWLAVQNDGNVVVYAPGPRALWDRYNGHH